MGKSLIFFVLGAAFLFAQHEPAQACVCTQTVEESFLEADLVFEGQVVEKYLVRNYESENYRGIIKINGELLVVEVGRVYKGEVDRTATVENMFSSCSVQGMEIGKVVYIVATVDDETGKIETNQCLHSAVRQHAEDARPGIQSYLEKLTPKAEYGERRQEEMEQKALGEGLPFRFIGLFN